MRETNLETGLEICAVDFSEVRIHQAHHRHKPDWKDEYLDLVKRSDYDAAHELRLKNDERYAEECEQEGANVFPVQSPALRSCREYASEIEAEMGCA